MKKFVKPIQPTPTLSGSDAQIIINEALTKPSDESISFNEKRLGDLNSIFKN